MEANQKRTTLIERRSRPWLLVGSLLVGRNTEEAMILLVGDRLLGPKGALLVDLLLVESSPSRHFALLVGSRLVDVPLRDTHGRDRRTTYSRTSVAISRTQFTQCTFNLTY